MALVASAGGLMPLRWTLDTLSGNFPAAVIVLQHRAPASRLDQFLADRIALPVHEAQDGEPLRPGTLLVAPPRVHMRVDPRGTVRLREGPRINFAIPSADVLFESLARNFGERVIGVVFSGRGSDGTRGALAIRKAGGFVIAQDERSAEHADMPVSATDVGRADLVLRADQIANALDLLVHPAAVTTGVMG